MIESFIKNPSVLEEKVSLEDFLGVEDQVDTLINKIEKIQTKAIIGFAGAFGVGKSTLLEKLKSKHKTDNDLWIDFDAWIFPERKELWDGLIMETAIAWKTTAS